MYSSRPWMAIIEMRRLTGSWQAMEIAVWARPLTRGEIYAVVEFYDQLLVGTPAPVPTHTGPYTGRLKLIGSGDKVGQCTDTCRVYSNHCRPIACGDGHSKIKWWANGYIQVGIERGCIAAWASEGCVAGAEYCLGLRSDQMVQKRECAASGGAPQMHRTDIRILHGTRWWQHGHGLLRLGNQNVLGCHGRQSGPSKYSLSNMLSRHRRPQPSGIRLLPRMCEYPRVLQCSVLQLLILIRVYLLEPQPSITMALPQ